MKQWKVETRDCINTVLNEEISIKWIDIKTYRKIMSIEPLFESQK